MEILIVVTILGILAALVVPRFASATDSARHSSLKTDLQALRSQIQLYSTQHNDQYPDLIGTGWTLLTSNTTANHTVSATGSLGPYLSKPPVNPFTNTDTVVSGASTTAGWQYNQSNGQIFGFIPEDTYNRLQLDDSDLITFVSP